MDNPPPEPPSAPRSHKRKASGDAPPALTTAALAAHDLRMAGTQVNSPYEALMTRYYRTRGGRRGAAPDLVLHGLRVGNAPPADPTGSLGIQDLHVASSPADLAAAAAAATTTTPVVDKEDETAEDRPRIHKPIPLSSQLTPASLIRLNERFLHGPNLPVPGYVPPTVQTGDSSVHSLETDRTMGSRRALGDMRGSENKLPRAVDGEGGKGGGV
ncbi:hypothetical protein DFP73DRAFT_592199 [Morchella snyderi]|nr:hypothetical protein DFP73DRAFT_592199 [Morchella snyderi]